MNDYVIGNLVLLAVIFTEASTCDLVDPTVVTLTIRQPNNKLLTLTYASGAITRNSAGNYSYEFQPEQVGIHYYAFNGTGSVIAANTSSFAVSSSPAMA